MPPGTSEPLCATISMLVTSILGPRGWIERIFLVFSGKFCSLLLVNRGSRCRAVKRQKGGGERRRAGQQRKGTHWPGNYRPRYKMQIGELILDGWILGIQPVLRFRQLWSLCQVLWGLGLGNWGSLIFAEPVGPIRILKRHKFAGKNNNFIIFFICCW